MKQRKKTCAKKDPLYKSIHSERFACKCQLIFSILLACIDLSKYDMKIDVGKGNKLVLTPIGKTSVN